MRIAAMKQPVNQVNQPNQPENQVNQPENQVNITNNANPQLTLDERKELANYMVELMDKLQSQQWKRQAMLTALLALVDHARDVMNQALSIGERAAMGLMNAASR
jgi:hypothetical protein